MWKEEKQKKGTKERPNVRIQTCTIIIHNSIKHGKIKKKHTKIYAIHPNLVISMYKY